MPAVEGKSAIETFRKLDLGNVLMATSGGVESYWLVSLRMKLVFIAFGIFL